MDETDELLAVAVEWCCCCCCWEDVEEEEEGEEEAEVAEWLCGWLLWCCRRTRALLSRLTPVHSCRSLLHFR